MTSVRLLNRVQQIRSFRKLWIKTVLNYDGYKVFLVFQVETGVYKISCEDGSATEYGG